MPPRGGDRAWAPVGFQRWRELLFVHWAVPPSRVRALVPPPLQLDLHDGHAWVTLIPFSIPVTSPAGMPAIRLAAMLETNVRTYVRGPDGERGIYFWSLEASSALAVAGARLLYGLPYFPAAMTMRRTATRTVIYTSRRRVGGPGILDVEWTVGATLGPAAPDTLDHFLIERYALYVVRGGRPYRARVSHAPYPLCSARVDHLEESLLKAAGLAAPGLPTLCHYSPGVDVAISWRRPIGGGR